MLNKVIAASREFSVRKPFSIFRRNAVISQEFSFEIVAPREQKPTSLAASQERRFAFRGVLFARAKNVILPGRVPGALAVFPFHKQSGAVHGVFRL